MSPEILNNEDDFYSEENLSKIDNTIEEDKDDSEDEEIVDEEGMAKTQTLSLGSLGMSLEDR